MEKLLKLVTKFPNTMFVNGRVTPAAMAATMATTYSTRLVLSA